MEKSYSVVHFLEENTVEAVPKIWIDNKKNICAWPKSCTKPSRLIENRVAPNDKEFIYFKVRELCEGIESFSKAKSKAKKAELTSDLSDTCENKVNRKFKAKKISYSSSSSASTSSDDECPNFVSDCNNLLPKNTSTNSNKNEKMLYGYHSPTAINKTKSPKLQNIKIQQSNKIDSMISASTSINQNDSLIMTPETKKRNGWSPLSSAKKIKVTIREPDTSKECKKLLCDVNSSPKAHQEKIRKQLFKMSTSETITSDIGNSASSSHDLSIGNEFEKRVLNLLVYIKVELKSVSNIQHQILERIDFLEKQIEGKANNLIQNDLSEVIDMQDCPLLIDGEVDLAILEDKTLGDRMFKLNLIYELSCVGGKTVKAAVKRIMAKLFTNNFLKEYSFSGRKGKKKFSDIFICQLIIKAVKKQTKFKNTTNQEIEETIRTILAQAPFAEKYYKNKNKILCT